MELNKIDLKVLSCDECTGSKVVINSDVFKDEVIFIDEVLFSIDGISFPDFYNDMFRATGVVTGSINAGEHAIPLTPSELSDLGLTIGDYLRVGDTTNGFVHEVSAILPNAVYLKVGLLTPIQNSKLSVLNTEIDLKSPIADGYRVSSITMKFAINITEPKVESLKSSHVIYCKLQKCFDASIIGLSTSLICCDDLEYINELMVLDSILAGLKTSIDKTEVDTLMSVSDRLCSFKSCASC